MYSHRFCLVSLFILASTACSANTGEVLSDAASAIEGKQDSAASSSPPKAAAGPAPSAPVAGPRRPIFRVMDRVVGRTGALRVTASGASRAAGARGASTTAAVFESRASSPARARACS